jgi:hypothetical protein
MYVCMYVCIIYVYQNVKKEISSSGVHMLHTCFFFIFHASLAFVFIYYRWAGKSDLQSQLIIDNV